MSIKRQFTASIWLVILLAVLPACENMMPGSSGADLVKAIPSNAAFIIKINDITAFQDRLSQRKYQAIIKDKLLPPEILSNHAGLTSILHEGGFVEEAIGIPLLASLHLESASKLNSIHYFPLSISNKAFNRQLQEKFPGAASQQWNYEDVDFHEILLPELNRKMAIAYSNGIVVTSPMAFLVEDAIKQLKSGKTLLDEEGFKKVYRKETNEADANLWMPFKNSRHWLSLFATDDGIELLGQPDQIASWMLMDIYLNEEEIFLSGITAADEGQQLSVMNSNAGCDHIIDDQIPFNAASYFHYSDMTAAMSTALQPLGIGNCWSKILIEPLNSSITDHFIFLLPLEDKEVFNDSKATADISSQLGKIFLAGEKASFQIVNDYVAVSGSEKTLENYARNIEKEQVLSKDETFLQLKDDLKTDANVTCYIRTMYHGETFNAVYESSTAAQDDFNSFKGFNQLAVQFSRQGDHFLTNATLTYNEEDGGNHTNLAWKVNLDAPVLAGPAIVALKGLGSKGVLVQDTDFMLYLIDKSGNTIWKKELESKWMGNVYALELYEGAGNAITFNTETNWYLLGEDGKDMAGFPLHFKDRASAPLAVTKMKEDHFVFIPSQNGHLYGYELSGKPMPGWNPKEKTGVIKTEAQLIVDGNDLLITATNENGMTYIWKKNGKGQARNDFRTAFPSAHFIDMKADPIKIKNVQGDGELVSMNAKGKVGRFKLPVSSIKHFAMANVRGNSDPEIILSTGQTVYLFSYTGERLWGKKYSGEMTIVKQAGKHSLIGIHNKDKNEYTVIDASGNELTPPLECGNHSLFSSENLLGEDQQAFITSGSEDELYCYRVALGE